MKTSTTNNSCSFLIYELLSFWIFKNKIFSLSSRMFLTYSLIFTSAFAKVLVLRFHSHDRSLARSFTCSYNSRRERAKGPIFGLNIPWLLPQSWNKDFYISSFGSAWPLSRIFVNRVKMLFFQIKTLIPYKMRNI